MFQLEEKLAVIDFGGQYTHLITRRIRELGIFSEIYEPDVIEPFLNKRVKAIIFSGGPRSVINENALKLKFDILKLEKPLLGICYGHQLIVDILGGKVEKGDKREYGLSKAEFDSSSKIFQGMESRQNVWMSHGDHVVRLPEGFRPIASTKEIEITAYENSKKNIYGVQFHPEVTHTDNGMDILENFVKLSGFKRNWKISNLKKTIIDDIKKTAQNQHLFLLLSGGVDSLVAFALCVEAIGANKIYPLHIDTGFMRKNESKEIISYFGEKDMGNIRLVNKEELFLKSLYNIIDPEEKREKIGEIFVNVLNEEIVNINPQNWMLVQGTIYPDTIESGGTKKASKIKTHHNRVKEIERLIKMGKVIEPLKELYKDEVRELGRELGLPGELVNRHPFPGPGLAIRVICSDGIIKDDYKKEENKLNSIINPYGFKGRILQVKTVGVQGDSRTYHHPALIWQEKSDCINWNVLRKVSHILINRLNEVNRVLYSYIPVKEKLYYKRLLLEKSEIDILREVDFIIRNNLKGNKEIWQVPVILLPLYQKDGKKVFVIRPVCSKDAMTADFYEMAPELLARIIKEVKDNVKEAGYIFYDLTTKPPGTIEWE